MLTYSQMVYNPVIERFSSFFVFYVLKPTREGLRSGTETVVEGHCCPVGTHSDVR